MTAASMQDHWREAIEAQLLRLANRGNRLLSSVVVLNETPSTQDAAVGAPVGRIVTTLRQTGGRGRHGRAWADDRGEGIAATFVVQADRTGRLAIAGAVAAAQAIESVCPISVGIKWPNDIIIKRRKVAGVLVEQDDQCARIGIGINVGQESWPADLASTAISLVQVGAKVERRDLLHELITAFAETLALAGDELSARYCAREEITGAIVDLDQQGTVQRGRVLDLRPLDSILFEPECGPARSIPVGEAAIQAIVRWSGDDEMQTK